MLIQNGRHNKMTNEREKFVVTIVEKKHVKNKILIKKRCAFALTPERRNENINVNKYYLSASGDRTLDHSILQSHFVPLRHNWRHT